MAAFCQLFITEERMMTMMMSQLEFRLQHAGRTLLNWQNYSERV